MHDERETTVAGKRGSHAFLDDDLGMLLPELGEQVSREKENHANFGGKERRHAGFGLFAGLVRGKKKLGFAWELGRSCSLGLGLAAGHRLALMACKIGLNMGNGP